MDDDGNIVNVAVWDGQDDWNPPEGEVVEIPDGVPAEPGGRRRPDGVWERKPDTPGPPG